MTTIPHPAIMSLVMLNVPKEEAVRQLTEGKIDFPPNTDSFDVSTISRLVPSLFEIHLDSAKRWITDEAVISIATNCGGNLTKLNVNGCNLLTDAAFISLGKNCSNLQTLIAYGVGLTDTAITSLAKGCGNLTTIFIGENPEITDAGFMELGRHCPYLEDVVLNYNHITDEGVAAIAEGCTELQLFSIQHCCHISDVSIDVLIDKCLYLQNIPTTGSSITRPKIQQLNKVMNERYKESLRDEEDCIEYCKGHLN